MPEKTPRPVAYVRMPTIVATTRRELAKEGGGSIYVSVLEVVHPKGFPRYLAAAYANALATVATAAITWGAPFCEGGPEFDLGADEKNQNRLDEAVQALDKIHAQIAKRTKGVKP